MQIQYVGFEVKATSRVYTFRVLDTLEQARQFTVKVSSDAFCGPALKLQDGPSICFGRLKHELDVETGESRAETHLSIEEQDIREYTDRHYPRIALAAKRKPYR
jgi:hypothetical protein